MDHSANYEQCAAQAALIVFELRLRQEKNVVFHTPCVFCYLFQWMHHFTAPLAKEIFKKQIVVKIALDSCDML